MLNKIFKKLSLICVSFLVVTSVFAKPIPNKGYLTFSFENADAKTMITCDIKTSSKNAEMIYIQACGPACYSELKSTINGSDIGNIGNGVNAEIKGNDEVNKLEVIFKFKPGFGNKIQLDFKKYTNAIINVDNCVSKPLVGAK